MTRTGAVTLLQTLASQERTLVGRQWIECRCLTKYFAFQELLCFEFAVAAGILNASEMGCFSDANVFDQVPKVTIFDSNTSEDAIG